MIKPFLQIAMVTKCGHLNMLYKLLVQSNDIDNIFMGLLLMLRDDCMPSLQPL